jgi:hypothetical protein
MPDSHNFTVTMGAAGGGRETDFRPRQPREQNNINDQQWEAFMSSTFRTLATLAFAIIAADSVFGAEARRPKNIVLFVPDGLRALSVTEESAPTMAAVRDSGVNFKNPHSVFPTFTTAGMPYPLAYAPFGIGNAVSTIGWDPITPHHLPPTISTLIQVLIVVNAKPARRTYAQVTVETTVDCPLARSDGHRAGGVDGDRGVTGAGFATAAAGRGDGTGTIFS